MMITKQQALEFIDELSKEFAIKMDLTSGVDCYFEVYSDEAGTHRLEGDFDSTEEVITEFMTKYINTNLFENIGEIPVTTNMLEVRQLYKVELDDWYDGDHTVHILRYIGKEGDFYTFETRRGYPYKYENKDFLQLWKIQEGAHD